MTSGTTSETTGETTGGVCEIELPDPGSCEGGAPAPTIPGLTLATILQPEPSSSEMVGAAVLAEPDDDPDFATTGCAFICDDVGQPPVQCDIWEQDCPEGEKCNAFANDGGAVWNATTCVPVDPDPDAIGEPCTVEGNGVSGVDSCDLGAMCWGVGGGTEGTCVELCTCSSANPICTTNNTTCTINNDGVLVLCLPVCDPLDIGACGEEEVCVSNLSGEHFVCVVDASGGDGAEGSPCEYVNACDPGLVCADGSLVPDCEDIGCCTPYCDVNDPSCRGGAECVPWYGDGEAPMCFEDLGACVLPS